MARIFCWFCLAACALATAADPDLPVARAGRIQGEVRVDGHLDEPFWEKAPLYSEFHRLDRKGGFAAEMERTEFRVACNDDILLVGIICYDPNMDNLIATVSERDGPAWSDDAIEVFLRLNDRFYYQFAVNSLGTVYDARGTVVAGAPDSDTSRARLWDGTVSAAVKREAAFWSVELQIPFATLDISPDMASTWRFNVGRSAARRKEYSSWAPVKRGFNDLPQHGFLQGITIDPEQFPINAEALEFPALRLGQNHLAWSLPTRKPGQFVVSSTVRPWQESAVAAHHSRERIAVPADGALPLQLTVPVDQAHVLMALQLEIATPDNAMPVLQRLHLFRAPEPMTAALEWAVYYQSESNARLTVDIRVAEASARGSLQAVISRDNTVLRQHQVPISQPGMLETMLPIAGLPPGFYQLSVSAHLQNLPPTTRHLRFHTLRGPFDQP